MASALSAPLSLSPSYPALTGEAGSRSTGDPSLAERGGAPLPTGPSRALLVSGPFSRHADLCRAVSRAGTTGSLSSTFRSVITYELPE